MDAKIQKLTRTINEQNKIIERIENAYRVNGGVFAFVLNLAILPFRIFLILNSNNIFNKNFNSKEMKFDEQTISSCLKLVNSYENKKLSPKAYADAIKKILKPWSYLRFLRRYYGAFTF